MQNILDDSFLVCRVEVSVTVQTLQKQKVVSNHTPNPVFNPRIYFFLTYFFPRLLKQAFYHLKESKVAAAISSNPN